MNLFFPGGNQRLLNNHKKTAGGEQETVQFPHRGHREGQRLLRGGILH